MFRRALCWFRENLGLAPIMAGIFAAILWQPDPGPPLGDSAGYGLPDWKYYRVVTERVRNGENYYFVAAEELSSHGYPTSSLFNWRTPLYSQIIASPLGEIGSWTLLLSLATSSMIWGLFALDFSTNFKSMIIYVLTAFVGLSWLFYEECVYYMESWSGILIYLSVLAFVSRKAFLGFGLALLSVLFREIAVVYIVGLATFGCIAKRPGYVWSAIGIISLFSSCMAMHQYAVSSSSSGAVGGSGLAWLDFGGLFFLITTCKTSYCLNVAPAIVTKLYLASGLCGGILLLSDAMLASLTLFLFQAFLCFFGKNYNYYWGLLCSPLLAASVAKFLSRPFRCGEAGPDDGHPRPRSASTSHPVLFLGAALALAPVGGCGPADKGDDRAGPRTERAPRPVWVKPRELDLGRVEPNAKAQGSVTLRNESGDLLVLGDAITTCPCVVASPDSPTIKSNGSTTVRVSFDPSVEPDFRGRLRVRCSLTHIDRSEIADFVVLIEVVQPRGS